MDKTLKWALIIGGIIVTVLVIFSVVAGLIWGWQGNRYGYGMMGGFGNMFFMPILGIVIVGLVVWAVVAVVQRPRESNTETRSSDTALEIIKQRYAKGEITKEEYEKKKKDLVS